MKQTVVLTSLLLAAFVTGLCAAELPKATAVRSDSAVKLDGALDEPCWQSAKPVGAFHLLEGEGGAPVPTAVKIAYDRAWLYFGIVCEHPAPDRISPAVYEHDGQVHMDESVELFIDPGTKGKLYFHFKLNAANVKAEQRMVGKKRDTGWDLPWLSAVTIEKNGWNAEIAIPLYVPASYGDLSKARVNVTRNAIIPDVDRQGVSVSERRQLSTWAPMIRSFHEPERFGALEGLKVEGLTVPFLASFEDARISEYYPSGSGYCYDVLLDVRGHNDKAGKVNIIVIDEPVGAKPRTISKTLDIRGTQPVSVKVPVPVAAPVQRTARVVMADAATGAWFRTTRITDTAALDMMSVFLDKTFYTTEERAVAVCSLGMPADQLQPTELVVVDENGDVLGRGKELTKRTALPFEIGKLGVGTHRVTVQWKRKSGELVFAEKLELVKLPPKPGLEWKVDKINKVLLHDGKPFFPYGILMAGINSDDEEDFKRVADAGFNSVAHWSSSVSPEEVEAYLKTARKYGLFVLGRAEAVARRGLPEGVLEEFLTGEALKRAKASCRSASLTAMKGRLVLHPDLKNLSREAKNKIFEAYYNANIERMLEGVKRTMEFPNLIGFNSFDEPCISVFDQDVQGRDLYHKIRRVDGYHPVFLLYSSYIPKGHQATDWCDALGTDPYWVPGRVGDRNTPNFVSKIVWTTKKRADSVQKATWIVPMGEYWSGVHKRAILPREQQCQTYLAIIHGAKALFYFRYPINHQMCWDALSRVARQLKLLGPIAVTSDIPQEIIYTPVKFDAEKDTYPDVQVALRRNPAGGLVLLAANTRPYDVRAVYVLSCLGETGEVGRLFGETRYKVTGRSFSEQIEPNGTRAYTIRHDGELDLPVHIEVASSPAHEPLPAPEVEIPRSGRPGKKNIAPNPSFEEASLPAWPDYYRPWYSEPLIGNENAGWGQDPTNPYHGKYCLKMTKNRRGWNGLMFYCSPQHDRPTRYVLSVYLRANRDGITVHMSGGGMTRKVVTLTTSWKRYYTVGTIPAKADRHNMFMVRVRDDGIVWADALQLEVGDEPTPFEE